ncbi:phosphatase PAP2 family protein [Cognatishimia sp. MH4019]|uniref:phosphatase PAP2 family protein n=1 Tax=Cognatishimia sp. MH4019 TaxID=2854030 RepID=UPI001CD3117F
MKRLAIFSGIYLAISVVIAFMFRDDMWLKLQSTVHKSRNFAEAMVEVGYLFAAALFLIFALYGVAELKRRAVDIGWAMLALILFQPAFTLFKTTMPAIVPFFADPFFAELDKALHFGTDPWVFAHKLDAWFDVQLLMEFYLTGWAIPAFFLPIVMAATDRDSARVNRTLIVFMFAWVGIGNVLALAGLSAGPVYYDRLLGTDRYPEMMAMLEAKGIFASSIGETQEMLWQFYTDGAQALGSGISAFPSVHVAVATAVALYMYERHPVLAIPGGLFWAAVMILSVYTGYHYAIDGYVSTLLVGALWAILVRKENRQAVLTPATV